MMKGIQRAIPWLLLAPAFIPLIYIDGLLYPYVAPKTFLFRTIGVGALASLLYRVLSNHPLYFERLRNWATWIPGALLIVAYVTSFFGIDFYHSFWSIFDRGDGLLTLTALTLLFYATLLTADAAFVRRLERVILWVATLVAAYTILQWVQSASGLDLPAVAIPRGRFGSTLGNAAYLSSFLGLTIFITVNLAREYARKWKKFVYSSLALQLVAIILAATRGTLLALGIVGLIAAVYYAWKGESSVRTYARYFLVAGLIIAGLFFAFRAQLAQVPIESVQRVASISLKDRTVESRLFIWGNMLGEAMQSPLVGYGAEHIDVLFNKFYDPTAIVEEWFDRSHNAFLDYLIQYGILGCALYIALIVSFIYHGFRMFQGGELKGGLLILLALTYAIQNFFVFDTAMTLWLFLVLFASQFVGMRDSPTTLLRMPKFPAFIPIGVAAAALILVIPISIQPLRANLYLAGGYLYHVVDVDRAVASMEKGLSLGTYADLEYGYQEYQMYVEQQQSMLEGEDRLKAYRFAVNTLGNNADRYPYDARTLTYLAHVLNDAPPEIEVSEEELRQVIARAIELTPKRLQPWYLLANVDIKKADEMSKGIARDELYIKGIQTLKEYAAVVPNSAEPRYIIATLYQVVGDPEEAKLWADEALPLYVRDVAVARRAARYYVTSEDWENASFFLQELVGINPHDYEVMYDLAKAKFLSGDQDGATAIVERLRVDAPGLVETDPAFLSALEKEE